MSEETPASLAPIEPVAANEVGASLSVEPVASQQDQLPSTSQDGDLVTPSEVSSDQAPIDPELLKALGEFTDESVEWGTDINDYLAKRWHIILKEGLKKEDREEFTKKNLVPSNCKLIQAPKLNPEIAAMLSDSSRNRDTRLAHKQSQLGCALTILGKVISNILINKCEQSELVRGLSELGRTLADSHYLETETRRSLIIPVIDKTYIDPFKERKRDVFLFGDNLGDFIKSSRGIKKTGQLIQPATGSGSNLNWRAPPPRSAQQYRPRGAPRGRGGGYRMTTAGARGGRRAPPPPPPTAPRRAPASASTQIPASAARYPAAQRRNR